jgi:hypothetical protein
LLELKGACNESRELADEGLELVIHPSSESVHKAAADGDNCLLVGIVFNV